VDDKTISNASKSINSWIEWLRGINLKAVKFNDPEVETLENGVSEAALDLFGRDSMEFDKFHEFRVCHGNWSLMDPSSEKQIKFERGVPNAITDLEELLTLIDSLHPSPGEDSIEATLLEAEIVPLRKTVEKPAMEKKTTPPSTPRKPVKEKATAPAKAPDKPIVRGKVLLLHSGENKMTLNVIDLLDRLNIDTVMPDDNGEDSISGPARIAERQDARFALFLLSADEKSLFGSLPGKIVKGKSRPADIFELGFLAGKLGPGNVGLVFQKDRVLDIPADLFGINYVPFEDGGGWKINLVKLLKLAGFNVDANVLFE